MNTTTEGMTAREAMRWYLDQPEGTEFQGSSSTGPDGLIWEPAKFKSVEHFARFTGHGWAVRIAAPKPAAPERVWVAADNSDRYVPGEPRPDDAIEYIRKDIAEAMVPKGREVAMSPVGDGTWEECWVKAPHARRVLILDGDTHD